jgi:hypothetical protein
MMILLKMLLSHCLVSFVLHQDAKFKASGYLYGCLYGGIALALIGQSSFIIPAILMVVLYNIVWLLLSLLVHRIQIRNVMLTQQLLLMIGLLAIYAFTDEARMPDLSILHTTRFWIIINALVVLIWPAGKLIAGIMERWYAEIQDTDSMSLRKAGTYIGILERLFVFTFVVTGHWDAIGFLVAAKSVFRFGDLKESKDRKMTEYILIGTLLSFGIALATGMLVLYLAEV